MKNMLIIFQNVQKNLEILQKLRELLKSKEINIIEEGNIINFENKKIHKEAFETLAKRDKNNPYIEQLKVKISENIKENILNSDFIFIINNNLITSNNLIYIISAWVLNKPTIFYKPISINDPYLSLIHSFKPYILNGKLHDILPVIKTIK